MPRGVSRLWMSTHCITVKGSFGGSRRDVELLDPPWLELPNLTTETLKLRDSKLQRSTSQLP